MEAPTMTLAPMYATRRKTHSRESSKMIIMKSQEIQSPQKVYRSVETMALLADYIKNNGHKFGIRNINYKATMEDITDLLKKYSITYKSFALQFQNQHRFKGEVHVEVSSQEEAKKLVALNQVKFYGRMLEIYSPELEAFKDDNDLDYDNPSTKQATMPAERPTFGKNPMKVISAPTKVEETNPKVPEKVEDPKPKAPFVKQEEAKKAAPVEIVELKPIVTKPVEISKADDNDPWNMSSLSAGPKEGTADPTKSKKQGAAKSK